MEIKKFGEVNTESTTDCRTDNGITVGLIDGLISIARILKDRLCDDPDVIAALKDLQDDEDIKAILNFKSKH